MKNNSDKKFKRTEIGMIPSDWDIINLNEAFNVLNNNTYSRDALNYIYGEYKNIHYGDILILFNEFVDLLDNKVPYLNNYLKVNTIKLEDGDIIFADTAEDETAGKAVEVINTKGIKAVSGLHTILCRKTQDIFSKYYLGYYFNSKVFHNQLLRYMTGSKVLSISKSDIKKTIVLLPPKPEQEKIANALTRIDNLIEDYEKLIKKKEKIKQGLMQNLLTGKVRLKGYDDKWSKNKIKDIYTITRGQVLSTKKIAKSVSNINCYPVYSSQTANNGLLGYYDKYLFDTCITWTTDGENAGTVKFRKGKFYSTNVNGVLISNSNLCNECMAEIINMNTSGFIVRNGNPKLMNNVMAEIEIYYPQDINEQLAISLVLSNADNEINDLKIKLNKIINIKKGMLDNLLTGKIRL